MLVAVLTVAAVAPAWAQGTGSTAVAGQVTDASGATVPGAVVVLEGPAGPESSRQTARAVF
jgi:hypothetical protein